MDKSISITSGKNQLAVSVFTPEENPSQGLPLIILGAGWKSTLENNYEFAQEVADGVAAVVVVFDYSGIGESTGSVEEISRAEHLADMIAVYDWALSLDSVDSKKVGVNGGSYSGYMATLLTAHRPVASLLLRAPAVFPDESFYIPGDTDAPRQERYFEQIVEGSTADMLTKALRKYTNPLLVQEREGDAIITPPIIDYFLGANNSTLQKHTVLKNAGHKISGESKQVSTKECIDWFKQTL